MHLYTFYIIKSITCWLYKIQGRNIRIWSWGITALTRQNNIVVFLATRMLLHFVGGLLGRPGRGWGHGNLVFLQLFGFLLQNFWLSFSFLSQGEITSGKSYLPYNYMHPFSETCFTKSIDRKSFVGWLHIYQKGNANCVVHRHSSQTLLSILCKVSVYTSIWWKMQ